MQVLDEAWSNFRDSINSDKTLQVYEYCLDQFLLNCDLDLGSLLKLESHQLTNLIIKYIEKKGGKLVTALYTFGKYDIVVLAELPTDEIAMSVSLATGALGNVRVTTLKAFDLNETKRIIDGLK